MSDVATELSFPIKPGDHADPTTNEVEVVHLPGFLQGGNKIPPCVALESGGAAPIDHRVDTLALNFGWTFQADVAGFDIDSSAALFSKDIKVLDFVWWDNRQTRCQSVRFLSADNLEGGGVETKETIQLELSKVPDEVYYILLAVSVYSKDHTLAQLKEVTLKARTPKDAGVFEYKVAGGSPERSLLIGCFVRNGESWEFRALADATLSRTISEIMHEPANLGSVRAMKPVPRIRRRLVVHPKEGRDLTPMDFSLLRKRSDPYLKVFFRHQFVMSDVVYATLNAKFTCDPLDIGEVSANSTDVMEIQCWDYDRFTKHDIMGVSKFCLSGLLPQLQAGRNQVWVKLYPTEENIQEKKKITGDILLEITVVEFH